ncbi:MAG: hypothetical protein H7Y89_10835 [Steroidobacteraceae bacterium]|nr:hypothetical protein [Steroidobacteraceae bacterium]
MLDKIKNFVTIISLCIAVFAAWKAIPADAEIKKLQARTAELDLQLKQADANLKAIESTREFSFALYKEVKSVIDSSASTSRQEDAVRVLVESLAEDPLRSKLLSVIAASAKNPEVKAAASATSKFYEEQTRVSVTPAPTAAASGAAAPAPTSVASALSVDFFYCELKRGTSEPIAQAARNAKPSGARGSWRARLLPESINQQPSYQITSSVIRFNPPGEREAAQELAKSLAERNVTARLQETDYPTPGYVSVFICQ